MLVKMLIRKGGLFSARYDDFQIIDACDAM